MKYIKQFEDRETLDNYVEESENGFYVLEDLENDEIVYVKRDEPVGYDYLTFTAEENNSTVGINSFHNLSSAEYSYDGKIWNDASGVTITLQNVGDSVKFRGEAKYSTQVTYDPKFIMTGKIAASGSIMSMLHKNPNDTIVDVSQAFISIFSDCSSLTQAPLLPATILNASGVYERAFYNCSSLTTAPELPATTVGVYCYDSMFYGCTSLIQAPELPALELGDYCYSSMFRGCSSLTQAPELPATTLSKGCYSSMFRGCSSLTQAPELPALQLTQSCYSHMFYACSSLTTAPELPAPTTKNYSYYVMFQNCHLLNKVIVRLQSWYSPHVSAWLYGVASTGDFYNLGGADIPQTPYGEGIPIGWTVHTTLD